ncbi:ankyrin repeat protein [Talaromyces stipitatus ATCC 10500]|uniref:Ankyrin repeat protein n=1 Tax=Talaromyces stipitatus (strain ATCC 10500 / CBS 375.48 / QM 6759 / NRRL 1006) TaxID=441959 RepID=B8M0K1_TALSN|nr:ankyrin repeat protein [Talaromyces stipitatus ATCC 10500]EED21298.1 ankyrin repeat protein [Talaromyces stipitatus ATCC 10500]
MDRTMSRSRSRSSAGSEHGDRLEPQLLRAATNNDIEALEQIVRLARQKGQLNPTFLGLGLVKSCERGCIEATQYLLKEGASVEVPGNRAPPIFRAVERNYVQIVKLLLDAGASPEFRDKEGRTALMTAAWKNQWHVLQLLISRGADVNARDNKKRNILHNLAADKQCDWGDDVVNLLLRTSCELDARDELGRTPLHWACTTGKTHFARLLLSRPQGCPSDYVNVTELRNKAALHLATAHDREDVVELLLEYGADVNARSDGGWTPFHNACDKGCEKIVRILLQAGADFNSQLLNGMTSLHLAAQAGHTDVVKCLLEQPTIRRRTRDTFGSTPFLRAAQFKRKDIVQLLAPFNHVEALSHDAVGACKGFEATIVDFGNFHNENRVKRVSVYELLYGRDAKNSRKQAVTTLPANVKASEFRWIHLPANNMAWVEALMTKSFIEEGASDVEGFKGLEKSFGHQHRGQRPHSHFMRPLCQSTPRSLRGKDEPEKEEESQSIPEKSALPQVVINGPVVTKTPEWSPAPLKKRETGLSKDSYSQDDDSSGRKLKAKRNNKSGKDIPKNDKNKSAGHGSDKHTRSVTPHLTRDMSLAAKCNICVYMPYLHFESAQSQQKMQQTIKQAETLVPSPVPGLTRASTRDEMLIRAHINSSSTSLHVRRTLDQFFYPNIDTETRDGDQVVYRYQTRWSEHKAKDPKIFMVDQLWMWVLGKNLIVTSFPQRWEQPKNDPLNVLDGIIEDINSKTREPVRSVYELATIITGRCSGMFDRHRMGDEDYQFLDMFESCIGTATDRETTLFREFNVASAQASEWLKHHRRIKRSIVENMSSKENDEDQKESDSDEESQPLFVDKLLDIGQETDLLAEAKDIRDELNMIRTVLEYQKQVLQDLQDAICEIYYDENRSQNDIKKKFREQQRNIDMHVKDVDRMDKQTERIYMSITDLLDLKQKHANAFEARFARDQAAGTAQQGKTIMMFTIVTIVFLPLSFIASFFAINVAEFPHDAQSGNTNMPLSYVSRYIFGIGFSISIPLILLALSVDDIRLGSREAWRRVREWRLRRTKTSKNSHHSHDHNRDLSQNSKYTAFFAAPRHLRGGQAMKI